MSGSIYLYSDQEIDPNSVIDKRLVDQIGKSEPKIAYIASEPDGERKYFNRKREYYSRAGANLTHYTDELNCESNLELLASSDFDAIHLSGGNTFHFLEWLRTLEVLPALKQYVECGGVLVGNSAGSILATPSIETAYLCGDNNRTGLADLRSLGLVDFYIWPHYRPASCVELIKRIGLPERSKILCVPDGCGVIVRGGLIETVGEVTTFNTTHGVEA